jgi:hypothetical protein
MRAPLTHMRNASVPIVVSLWCTQNSGPFRSYLFICRI